MDMRIDLKRSVTLLSLFNIYSGYGCNAWRNTLLMYTPLLVDSRQQMSCILHMLTLSMLMMSLLLSAFSSCPAYRPFVSPFLFFRDSCQLSQQATPCCSHIALRLESFSSSVQTQKELSSSAYKNAHLFFFFKKYVLLSFVVHHA